MCVTDYGVEGFIKMDLPNSWECPRCIKAIQDKKEKEKEEENIKEEQTSTGPDGQPLPPKIPKLEPPAPQDPLRRPISSGSDANVAGAYQLFSVCIGLFRPHFYIVMICIINSENRLTLDQLERRILFLGKRTFRYA